MKISFEQAILAKNKGFTKVEKFWNVASLYTAEGEHQYYTNFGFMSSTRGYVSAPTQAFLAEWLREQNIQIDMFYEDGLYSGRVFKVGDPDHRWQSVSTLVYERTLEVMLQRGLEYL
jgi:hypothetical protein